jgi:hypothetical protein
MAEIPTPKAVAIRRAVPPPVIHPSLKRPSEARSGRAPLGPQPKHWANGTVLGLLIAAMVYCASVADFTEEAWPLAILVMLPFTAIGFDAWSARQVYAQPRRNARLVADRRPVLLRPVLVVPAGRPKRIIAKLPRLLVQIPTPPDRRRPTIRGPARTPCRIRSS